MFWIIWGWRAYGRVDAHGGEHAHTRFFHLWYLPIVPTQSAWSTRPGHAIVTRWNRKSVVATYLRMWGPLAALGCFLAATIPSLIAGAAFAALSAYAWLARGTRNVRRSDFNLLAFNTRCEPALLTSDVRRAMKQTLDTRWQKLDVGRSPDEVAQLGARSLDEAVIAYGLLRIAGVEHRASNALADRIVSGTYDPAPVGDGPYRDDQVEPIAGAVIEQAEAAVAKRQPALAPGLASSTPWWTFSANLLAATLVVGVVALAIVVNKVDTLRGPQSMTADQIAAGFENHTWVTVDCDGLEPLGVIRDDSAEYACNLGDHVLAVDAPARERLTSPITGTLNAEAQPWSRLGPTALSARLESHSILFIQAIVIVSLAYETFFVALIGFWIVRRFRRRPSL